MFLEVQTLAAKMHRYPIVLEDGSSVGVFTTPITGWRPGNEFYLEDSRFRIRQILDADGARRGADAVFVVTRREPA